MSTARLQKREDAEHLREELAEIPHAILVDFQGLNVEGATSLRRKLREGDARLKVVKNSTALRAIEDLPLAELRDVFVGQTAIAYTDGDVVALAKTLREFAKERVAAYKYPRVVWVTSELPMGPTGKILKREIDIPTPAASSGDEFPTQTLPDPS